MGKNNIKTSEDELRPFFNYKSYSIDEIIAAGGATAFANKLGKNPQNIIKNLKTLPKDAFFTDEEVRQALETLKTSK
ncbi:hypothetical protein [Mucilaginibacter sp.]|uniref:hypothetical protein n=1 Tax=Mucilaginibacter sp. TaxID=1882438 RepID=UPI002604B569|nr:hypothetical protein [Mucilaginibacter sp.]